MEENHQDNVENKLKSTENTTLLLLSEAEDEKEAQKELTRLRKRIVKNEKGAFNATRKWTGFQGKTLWDWLNLLGTLAIPLVVVSATIGFGWWQAHLADVQHQQDQQNVLDQQQEATLSSYLNDMSDLLLNHNLGNSKPGNEVRQVAKTRTLTTLRRLNADRNKIVLQFLQDANLIAGQNAVVSLSGADLSNDDLSGADLADVDLSGAFMVDTDLSYAVLRGANLSDAKLDGANLSNAFLFAADLKNANLPGADLSGTDLSGTDLSFDDLSNANLSQAHQYCFPISKPESPPLGFCANLSDADLTGAVLTGADLPYTNLSAAKLSDANLSNTILAGDSLSVADLAGANLGGADLRGAYLEDTGNLDKAKLQGAKYTTKVEQIDFGRALVTLESTQWPQGFNPQAAGAICVDC